jgi:hypothetical protein
VANIGQIKAKSKPFDNPRKRWPRKKLPDERALVNALIQQMKINTPYNFYYFIDRDSGQVRNTKSPWDFHLMRNGITKYYEAKVEDGELRPHQRLSRKEITLAGGYYGVPRFRNVKSLLDCDVYLEAEEKPTKKFRLASATFAHLFDH